MLGKVGGLHTRCLAQVTDGRTAGPSNSFQNSHAEGVRESPEKVRLRFGHDGNGILPRNGCLAFLLPPLSTPDGLKSRLSLTLLTLHLSCKTLF